MTNLIGKDYKEHLVEMVKAAGQEVIERAEDLVGSGDLISDFDIWLRFPQDNCPTIEVTRSHISKKAVNLIMESTDGVGTI